MQPVTSCTVLNDCMNLKHLFIMMAKAMHPRFIGENLEKNKFLYKRPKDLASKHACTPSQLALAWLLQQGNDIIPIPSWSGYGLMAFGGPAPERINGRLAIGFVAAKGVELANGQGVFEQISGGGIPWFLGTSVLLSLASFIPLFQGGSVESKSKGVFSSDAEL